MAQNTVDKIVVDQLTKFGFKVVGASDYVNYSKNLAESDKTKVVPGASLEVEFYVADSGKRYLNKVLSQSTSVSQPTPIENKADTARAKHFTPKFTKKEDGASATMSKDEWAAKDKRISRQGCIQAAVHALAPVVSEDILMSRAADLAEQMLNFVNEVK